jgi:hypothetical protein
MLMVVLVDILAEVAALTPVLVYLETLKLVGVLEELLVEMAMPTPMLAQEPVQVAMS